MACSVWTEACIGSEWVGWGVRGESMRDTGKGRGWGGVRREIQFVVVVAVERGVQGLTCARMCVCVCVCVCVCL